MVAASITRPAARQDAQGDVSRSDAENRRAVEPHADVRAQAGEGEVAHVVPSTSTGAPLDV